MKKKVLIICLIIVSVLGIVVLLGLYLKKKPVYLDDEYYGKYALIDINKRDYQKLIDDKKTFMVAITLDGCISCEEFKPILKEYMETNKLTMYHLEFKEMMKTDLYNEIKYSPSVVIIKNGKLVAYLDSNSNDDMPAYETVKGLDEWVKNYIKMK